MNQNKGKIILLINQYCGFLCRDMANEFSNSFDGVELMTGNLASDLFENSVIIKKFTPYNRKNTITRFFSWFIFTIQVLISKKKNSYSAWVLVTNPPFMPLILGYMAYKRKIPFFIVIYDLYPEALNQIKILSKRSFLSKLWGKLNQNVFSKSAGIITLSGTMKARIEAYVPKEKTSKIIVIPNWFDAPSSLKSKESINSFAGRWKGKLVVLYAGNFGLTHDLESLIEAANTLKDEPNIHFVLAGDGGKKSLLINLADDHGLKNVEFLPFQSSADFQDLLSSADIGVVSSGKGTEAFSLPSKTYTYMSAGLCILGISEDQSALMELINQYQIGKNAQPGDIDGIQRILLKLSTDKEMLNTYKMASIQGSQNFTTKNVKLYSEFIKSNIP